MNKKKMGLLSATALGVSSIIGSGWLFAPYKSAVIAGPAALISWLVSGALVILLGMCFAEIASLFPRRGLSAVIPAISHNKFFGFPFAIASWFGVVALISLEADASIQYLINLVPHFKNYLFNNGELTFAGNSFSIGLVVIYSLINYWGVVTLAKTNNILTILKVLVPIITAFMIIAVAFHPKNFAIVGHSFVPYGVQSIFLAILNSGIIIAFNGFQTIVSFSSEIKRPHRTIPWALFISIVFCLGIYLLLELSFIGAIPTQQISNGWQELKFSAPMVEVCLMIGLGLLTSIIYFGATIAPSSAGLTYVGSATRMFTAMSRHDQMPKFFDKVHPVYGVSRRSLLLNMMIAILFLLWFRSWNELAGFLSLLHLISYLPLNLSQKPSY